jgi:hypothetical protein
MKTRMAPGCRSEPKTEPAEASQQDANRPSTRGEQAHHRKPLVQAAEEGASLDVSNTPASAPVPETTWQLSDSAAPLAALKLSGRSAR